MRLLVHGFIFLSGMLQGPARGNAESVVAPCYRFSYASHYQLDKTTPSGIRIAAKVGAYEGSYLFNAALKPLIIQVHEHKCIKLMNGHFYEGRNCGYVRKELRPEYSDVRIHSFTSLGLFAKNQTVSDPSLRGSNDSPPPKPASYQFEINGTFDDKPIVLRVTGSYVLKERPCGR